MDAVTVGMYADLVDILVKLTVVVGSAWAVYKFVQFRELKQRIQLDIDAHLYRLAAPEQVGAFTWDRQGKRVDAPVQPRTHAIEILLKFTNKGFTRLRLFNVQVGINTMRAQHAAQFDEDDGHLHLTRIHTSGNVVPLFPVKARPSRLRAKLAALLGNRVPLFKVKDRPVEETSFYYIEPGVEQTISYLTLIAEPRELVQIFARFNLEQKRLFPERAMGEKGLYPHTAAKTYQVKPDGSLAR